MDPEIWSKLPQEQLLDVLARLPICSIARLREVCKKWSELLVAKHFTDRIRFVRHSQTPFLLVCIKRYQAIAAYNPALREWRELFIWKKSPVFQIHCLCATGGGLLLFKGNMGKRKSNKKGAIRLLVCNPITKLWRILPRLPPGIRTVGCVNVIVLEDEPNRYNILFTLIYVQLPGHPPGHPRLLVGTLYDSAAETWTTYYEDTTLLSIYRSVYVNGSIHYIGCDLVHLPEGTYMYRRHGVSFDLYRKVFSRFDAPLMSEVGAKKFMELHGLLSLVSFSTEATFLPSVQHLDPQTRTWVDGHLLPPGASHGVESQFPLGQGSYVYFADCRRRGTTVMCYDLLSRDLSSFRFLITEEYAELRSQNYKLYHPSLCSV